MNNDLVILELDKVRTLKYGIKAIKQIEKLFGCKLSKAMDKMNSLSIDELVKIIHIGLAWEDDSLTIDKLEELIDEYTTVGTIIKKMTDALNIAFGGEKNDQGMAVPESMT